MCVHVDGPTPQQTQQAGRDCITNRSDLGLSVKQQCNTHAATDSQLNTSKTAPSLYSGQRGCVKVQICVCGGGGEVELMSNIEI